MPVMRARAATHRCAYGQSTAEQRKIRRMDVFAIFLGAGFGFVLVLGGLSWFVSGIRGIWRWLRTRAGGEVVEAQIVDRWVTQDHKADAPPTYYATLRWLHGLGEHTSEVQIPERWYQSPEGEPVSIRIHPDRPGKPIIVHWSANPAWKLLGMVFGTAAFLIGVGLLAYVGSGVCGTYGNTAPAWMCNR